MTATYTPSDTKHATASEFDDGDAPQATLINPLGEAGFDTATYAANRVGNWRVIRSEGYTNDGTYGSGAVGGNSNGTFDGTGDLLLSNLGTTDTVVGDVVEVTVQCVIAGAVAMQAEWRLAANQNGAGKLEITGARHYEHNIDANYRTVVIHGRLTITSAGSCLIYLQCRSAEAVPLNEARFYKPITATIVQRRENT